jgi:hypothetical protein
VTAYAWMAPDDEFEAMRQTAQNSAYVVGWYDGVSDLYREQMTRRCYED